MFTGIVEAKGRVVSLKRSKLTVRVPASIARSLKKGSSLAVNGTCLTVVAKTPSSATFDLVRETLKKTNLSFLEPAAPVNLERPLKAGSRLDGHFVQGHVDGTGEVRRIAARGAGRDILIRFSKGLAPYVVPKGSLTVDGVSLTIGKIEKGAFWAHIIPHTLRSTNIRSYRIGTKVNLEADLLLKFARGIRRRD